MADYDLYDGKPPHVADNDTSEAAADAITMSVATLRARIYSEISKRGVHGATDDEMQVALGIKSQTQSPRRRELVMQGRVADSGRRRNTRSGRSAKVWVTSEVPLPPVEKKKTVAEQLQEAKARIKELEQEVRLLTIEVCALKF